MHIREIKDTEIDDVRNLVLDIFMKYEAPDYSEEGIESFQRTAIENDEFIQSLAIYCAYEKERIVGVIATRCSGNHIALLFVDDRYHRMGIGRKLFQTVLDKSTEDMTVNSSPYAREVYHHLGFRDTAPEQETDGIRYTPMVYQKEIPVKGTSIPTWENPGGKGMGIDMERGSINSGLFDSGLLQFFDRMPQILPIYQTLEEKILAECGPAEIQVKKTQITFKNRYGFAFASLPGRRRKDWPDIYLLVTFGLSYHKESPRIIEATEPYPGRWTHHVIIQSAEELDGQLLGWIKEAYDYSMIK